MYRSQLLEQTSSIRGGTAANGGSQGVYLYNRFGKIGEVGKYTLDGPYDSEDAIKEFKKVFQSKTKNKWENRDSFVQKPDKYGEIAYFFVAFKNISFKNIQLINSLFFYLQKIRI